jgi:hypothetical protein
MEKGKFLLVFVLAACFALGGCSLDGSDGKIYGQYDYETGSIFSYLKLGGFPDGTLYKLTSYEIEAGTYDVYFTIRYGGYYWPGNATGTGGTDSGYYWHGSYTVAVNKGSFMKNGLDKEFVLYLHKNYGLQLKSGSVTLGDGAPAKGCYAPPKNGASVSHSTIWTSEDGAVTVTVASEVVRELPAKSN